MTPRHANRGPDGKFVRADGKATLHRQVSDVIVVDRETQEACAQTLVAMHKAGMLGDKPRPDPHGPRIELSWPLVFFVAGLVATLVMGVWLAGRDGGLW